MTTDRDRLTTFFYLLTHGTPVTFTSKPGEALAREMVDRLLGPEAVASETMDPGWPSVDRRRETLLAVAHMLTELRDTGILSVSRVPGINDMIDRCNLDAMPDGGVVHARSDAPTLADLGWHQIVAGLWERGFHRVRVDGCTVSFEPIHALSADDLTAFASLLRGAVRCGPEPLTLETASAHELDFAGEIIGAQRESQDTDAVYRDALRSRLKRTQALLDTGATAAEVERLRRFEAGVTALLGAPTVGTDAMLQRLRLSGVGDSGAYERGWNGALRSVANELLALAGGDRTVIGLAEGDPLGPEHVQPLLGHLMDKWSGPWVVAWEAEGYSSAIGYWTKSEAESKVMALRRYSPILRDATYLEATVIRLRSRGVALHDLQPIGAKS